MADEKKPDEEVQVDALKAPPQGDATETTETTIVEVGGTEPEKFVETPEDIEKSRAFHQKQAQEKDEELKAAQTELDQIYADLDAADPVSLQRPPEPTPEKKTPPVEPVLVDDDGQPNITAIIDHAVSKAKNDLTLDFEQKQEKIQLEQDQRSYVAEQQRARKAVTAYQTHYDIPKEVMEACDIKATAVVGDLRYLGAFTRWAKAMRDTIDHHRLQSSITKKATTAEANAAAQIEHAGKVAQPSGSAISPPEAASLEKWNQQQADDIAEDDPPVG